MIACPGCGSELSPAAISCPSCGAATPGDPPRPAPPAPVLPSLARSDAARWTVATWLSGVSFVLALACNLLIVVLSVPNLTALALSSVAAIVPAALYSLIVIAIDRFEREPLRVLLGSFAWGALVATLFSLFFGGLADVVLGLTVGEPFSTLLGASFVAPFVEESFKGIAILGLLLLFRDEFDNILDGLVYGALIGLGFAMTENILYLGNAYIERGATGFSELFIAREVFGGFGHALYTGTTGAAVGWARERRGRGREPLRFIVPLVGWALAVFQHFLWNAGSIVLAVIQGPEAMLIPTVILGAVLFTSPGLAVLVAIAAFASLRESRILREHLADEVARGIITPAEYATLAHAQTRQQAAWQAFRRGGIRRWLAQERFFQAAAELAFRKHHRSRGENPTTEDLYRARLAAIRDELQATVAARR